MHESAPTLGSGHQPLIPNPGLVIPKRFSGEESAFRPRQTDSRCLPLTRQTGG